MTQTSKLASKVVVSLILVISMLTASGFLSSSRQSGRMNSMIDGSGKSFDDEECAIRMMEKYNCTEPACDDIAENINYLYLWECDDRFNHAVLSIFFLFMVFLLLILLATTADKYFCVIMENIVEKMKIPPRISGVTFLAFGNGAPDVFSLLASIVAGSSEIGVGANVGAGVFVTTVVAGLVTVTAPCTVNRVAFLRDIFFYLTSVVYLIFVFHDNMINVWEGIGFIFIYVAYVFVVFFSRKFEKKYDAVEEGKETTGLLGDVANNPAVPLLKQSTPVTEAAPGVVVVTTSPEPVPAAEPTPEVEVDRSSVYALTKASYNRFLELGTFGRIVYVVEYVFIILRDMTVPLVADETWNKYWTICASALCPYWFCRFMDIDTSADTSFGMPLWGALIIFTVILVGMVSSATEFQKSPSGFIMVVLILLGFAMSVVWISAVANEMVALLTSVGLLVHIKPVFLGLSIVAWGNSLGDIVSDTALAKQGFAQMAMSGVYAAPMFNMLCGMGLSVIICISNGSVIDLGEKSIGIYLCFGALLFSLLSTAIIVPLNKFSYKRWHGVLMFVIYIAFFISSVIIAPKGDN